MHNYVFYSVFNKYKTFNYSNVLSNNKTDCYLNKYPLIKIKKIIQIHTFIKYSANVISILSFIKGG